MKNKLLFTLLFSSSILFAQEKLSVEYRYTIKHDDEKMKEFEMQQAQKGSGVMKLGGSPNIFYQLEFSNNQSNFKKVEVINNDQNNGGGMNMSINIGGEYKTLTNNIDQKKFQQEVFLDKQDYVVITPYKDYQWKITDIEDTILGYKVIKAVGVDNGKQIAAWYAPELKIDAGPNQINGLPGLVLKTVSELGNKLASITTYEAEKINVNPKKMAKIQSMKGKEISQEEFKKLQDESREKMRQSFSIGVDKS